MLFYYFKSKKELFYYLIDYGADFVTREYINKLDESETDFIKKCKQAVQVKMAAIAQNPHVSSFLGSLYLNQTDLPEELAARLVERRKAANAKLYDNVDTSLFRDDLAPAMVIKLIQWTMDGIEKELVSSLNGKKLTAIDMTSYWDLDEFNNYLAILKKLYYK